jgi:dTDP-4-amino-4,6-dideoxygalactose transaminase
MREKFLPFALPDVNNDELEQVKEALFSGWITTGPKTKQFEAEFAQFLHRRYASSAGSGWHSAWR